ncbi:UNVERIFIED_CONTAM: hypothetical protein KWG02_03040 [Acinetobacter baumannii]
MRYFFGRKKGTAKPIKTVLGTSQVLLLLQVFSRDDLKPESANGPQTALSLCGVVIAFGIENQEIMDVQSQLLFIGSSARHE